ncbi:hypothetical protein F9K33_10790 [bacterium]|nr:MAG: hypothetical protein F9K33_10790 [bacterium]
MNSLYSRVESTAKALLSVTSVCYVIGLIVLNLHFSQFGFYSFELLQLNYIFAGIWCLTVFGSTALIVEFTFHSIRRVMHAQGIGWKFLVFFNYVFLLGMSIYVLHGIAVRLDIEINMQGQWKLILLGGVFLYLLMNGKIMEFVKAKWKDEPIDEAPIIIFIVFLITGYLLGFGSSIYKTIPANVGGGKPISVEVILDKEIRQAIIPVVGGKADSNLTTQTESICNSDSNLSVQLVAVINDLFYFRHDSIAGGRSFAINRNAIRVLFFDKH